MKTKVQQKHQKSQLFEKANEIGKALARLIEKKESTNNIRTKQGMEIQIQHRLRRKYHEQIYANEFEYLDKNEILLRKIYLIKTDLRITKLEQS